MSETTPPPEPDPDDTVAGVPPGLDETLFVDHAVGGGGEAAPFRIGPYVIESELGRGGMGVVYLGRDPELGRTVAVKILPRHFAFHPQARARFRREAEAASKLDHPGLCGIIGVGEQGDLPWIAMQFIEGVPLSELVEQARARGDVSAITLPEAEGRTRPTDGWRAAADLIARMARALHVAHQKGVLHRDLKPGNVMIRPDGRPVILDFGLACDTTEEGPALTASGDVLGTPSYMAPEQIRGAVHRADATLDVWALGVMLYQLLTLELPFAAPTRDGVYRNILEREPLSLRRRGLRIPGDLQIVLDTALQKEARRRYASAKDLADDLQRVLDIEPILARAPGPIDRAVKLARRRPALTTLVVALAVLIPTLLGLWIDRTMTRQRVSAGVEEKIAALGQAIEHREPTLARRLLQDVRTLAPEDARLEAMSSAIERETAFEGLESLVLDREIDSSGQLARAELETLRRRWPDDRRLESLTRLLRLRLGTVAPAETSAETDEPLQRALELAAAGEHESALERLEALLERSPGAHWIAWAAADEASRVQLYDKALALARAARAASNALVPRRRGRYSLHLRRAGERELALEHAERAHEADATDVVLRLHLANALAELRRREEAITHLEAALTESPTFSEAWRALGAVRFDLEEWDEAEAALRQAIETDPESAAATYNLANVMIELERTDEALALLDRTLELNADFVYALNSKGHLLRRLGRYDEARTVLAEAIRRRPRYSEAVANLGTVHFAEGDVETAERLYREAIALDPNAERVRFNLALLLHNNGGKPEDVIALYRRVLELNPDDAETLTNLANILSRVGEHEEAVRIARRSTEVAPDDPLNWNNLGTSCVEASLLDDAVAALERALALDPVMLQPHVNLMIILSESDPLRALAHALEVPRIDTETGMRARMNAAQLHRILVDRETDHPLVDAVEALDLADDDADEARDLLDGCLKEALGLPRGEPAGRDRIIARSAALTLLDVATRVGTTIQSKKLRDRAASVGLGDD